MDLARDEGESRLEQGSFGRAGSRGGKEVALRAGIREVQKDGHVFIEECLSGDIEHRNGAARRDLAVVRTRGDDLVLALGVPGLQIDEGRDDPLVGEGAGDVRSDET